MLGCVCCQLSLSEEPAARFRRLVSLEPGSSSAGCLSSSQLCCLLPPAPSWRYWAAVATLLLTVTLPSAANQRPAASSPSFQTRRRPSLRSPQPGEPRLPKPEGEKQRVRLSWVWVVLVSLLSREEEPALPAQHLLPCTRTSTSEQRQANRLLFSKTAALRVSGAGRRAEEVQVR